MRTPRLLPLIGVVFAFISLVPSYAEAQALSGYCGRETAFNNDSTNLTWQVDTASRVLTISGVGLMKDYSTDTKAPWYDWRYHIDRVVIGDGVTTVGTYAMYDMRMDSVQFGSGLERIREYGFYCSRHLRSVYMNDNMKQIEYHAFANCDSIRVVDMGNSPASIGSYAFAWCNKIRKVHFSRVKETQWESFSGCWELVDLNLGDSLYYLGARAFNGCNSLRSVHLPATLSSMSGGAFVYAYVLDTIEVDPANPVFTDGGVNVVLHKGDNVLVQGCRQSVIPAGTKGIAAYAFEGCVGLQSIVIPEGVEYVSSEAFQNCTGLQSVTFPNSITRAECNIFTNCTSLKTPVHNNRLFVYMPRSYKTPYSMPNTIREITCGAMQECDSLVSIRLSDSLELISSNAMNGCRSLLSLHIPDRVQNIQSYSLAGCSSLRSLSFPADLIQLGEGAINYCYSLDTITWNCKDAHLSWIFYDPNYYENAYLHEHMDWYHPFYGIRKQIRSFAFGDSVRVIPRYLCYEMENLTSLSFGTEVDSIEGHVFDGCNRISSVYWNARSGKDPILYTKSPFYPFRDTITSFTFGDSVRHIPAYICHGMGQLHRVLIPKKVETIGDYAFRYLGVLDSIAVDPANTHYDSRGGCNALIETATNNLMLGCYKTRIPSDIQSIDACAFRKVRNFTTAIIPEGVTSIGKEAFNGCVDLKTLSLPRKLTAINDYTFQDCDSLYNVVLPDSLWYVGLRAFANCTHLQQISLPESVELLDQYAFSGCSSLQNITCYAVTPPAIQQTTFLGTSCPIYVPCPSITAYRTAPIWTSYGKRVSGLYSYVLKARPNDFSYGRVTILQQPDCENNAILKADAIFGHEFVEWQDVDGNVLSTSPRYEFYVGEDMTVIGVFKVNLDALEGESASRLSVRVEQRNVLVLSDVNTTAALYDLTGHLVDAASVTGGAEAVLVAPESGVYIVRTPETSEKVMIH